jgi:hypothetical protein
MVPAGPKNATFQQPARVRTFVPTSSNITNLFATPSATRGGYPVGLAVLPGLVGVRHAVARSAYPWTQAGFVAHQVDAGAEKLHPSTWPALQEGSLGHNLNRVISF